MRVLITGGTGNLARYCLDELLQHGHEVTLFDRFRPEEAARPWTTDAPVVVGDLTSRKDCWRAVETSRAEGIVHLGAIPYASEDAVQRASAAVAGQALVPVDATFRVNTLGTYYLLEAAREEGAVALAFASTASVLLETNGLLSWLETLPVDESHPLRPSNSYSVSKYLNEETLWLFGRDCGIRCVALRMIGVLMPHHDADWDWNPRVGGPAKPPEAGEFRVWEYLDARDAAVAYRLSLEADDPRVSGPMYLATDRTCPEEHRELIRRYYPQFSRQADAMGPDDLILSIRRAKDVLGYVPRHSWRGPQVGERLV